MHLLNLAPLFPAENKRKEKKMALLSVYYEESSQQRIDFGHRVVLVPLKIMTDNDFLISLTEYFTLWRNA